MNDTNNVTAVTDLRRKAKGANKGTAKLTGEVAGARGEFSSPFFTRCSLCTILEHLFRVIEYSIFIGWIRYIEIENIVIITSCIPEKSVLIQQSLK